MATTLQRLRAGCAAIALLASCSRSTPEPTATMQTAVTHAAPQTYDADGWRVAGDVMCGVQATAKTLDALCPAVEGEASKLLGVAVHCDAGKPLGVGVDRAMAVADAAVLQIVADDASKTRYSLLALQTQRAWRVVRNVGTVVPSSPDEPASITLVDARPIDVPGLEPVAVETRVAHVHGNVRSERLFVCGVAGDGALHCPLSAVVGDQLDAKGVASSVGAWRVSIDPGAQGFVARVDDGRIPVEMRGILGAHGWGEASRKR
jgi:hypothetical protein